MKRYIQSEELKTIQLDILNDIASFCEDNNLSYFLSYGTLIGAIRHNGYIPWDDDIDICMPRPDYDKFLEKYNNRNSSYKVISHEIDGTYSLPFGKVHDTRTVMNETMYKQDCFGVYVDVFPLDGCDKKGSQIKITIKLTKLLNAKKAILDGKRSFVKNIIIALGKVALMFVSVNDILLKFKKACSDIPYSESEYVASVAASYGVFEVMKKSDLEETIFHDFEGCKFRVPKNYDMYLKQIYGDYMQLPPEDKRVSHHTFEAWWKE